MQTEQHRDVNDMMEEKTRAGYIGVTTRNGETTWVNINNILHVSPYSPSEFDNNSSDKLNTSIRLAVPNNPDTPNWHAGKRVRETPSTVLELIEKAEYKRTKLKEPR